MTWINASALYLLLICLPVILFHLLRARERRREVSSLFLWEGLPGDQQSRMARLRHRVDPLLLLQLAALLFLVVALARPAAQVPRSSLSGLALVIDASASMRTADGGGTRYDRAIAEAFAFLRRASPASTALVQLSAYPRILASPGSSAADLEDALLQSRPTWFADGSPEALLALLSSLGGAAQFESIVLISDRAYPDLPGSFDLILLGGDDNLAVTAFSVREYPAAQGVSAFVAVLNDSNTYQNAILRIDDRENQTTLSIVLSPRATERFIVPFPTSRGTLFTATIEPTDAFPADNRRFFSLERPLDVRVRWLGPESRYLRAALAAVAPITWVSAAEAADLTVVHRTTAPATEHGAILLVHAGFDGLITLSEPLPTPSIDIVDPDHPLLADVDPTGLRFRSAPAASVPPSAEQILSAGEIPLLATYEETTRKLFYLAPDLLETNLPITMDFPILIRNVLATLTRPAAALTYRTAEVGEPVALSGRGSIEGLFDPEQRPIPLPAEPLAFRPSSPGFHVLETDRGAFAIAVNVPASESVPTLSPSALGPPHIAQGDPRLLELWPFAAGIAAVLLLTEAYAYARQRGLLRRIR